MNNKNLKPFKKGHPGGPGRPKGSISITNRLTKYLEKQIKAREPLDKSNQELKTFSLIDLIILRLIENALNGDIKAITTIFDRIDGKVSSIPQPPLYDISLTDIKRMSDEELDILQKQIINHAN